MASRITRSWSSFQHEPSFHLPLGASQGRLASLLSFIIKFRFIAPVGSQSWSIFQHGPSFHLAFGEFQGLSSHHCDFILKSHSIWPVESQEHGPHSNMNLRSICLLVCITRTVSIPAELQYKIALHWANRITILLHIPTLAFLPCAFRCFSSALIIITWFYSQSSHQ